MIPTIPSDLAIAGIIAAIVLVAVVGGAFFVWSQKKRKRGSQ